MAMSTLTRPTTYLCRRCGEPKNQDPRTGDWMHVRGDSLCDNDGTPRAVTPLTLRKA